MRTPARPRPSAATLAAVAASYFLAAAAATYPVILTFRSALPGELSDPLEHLWIMRWARSCLLEGRSPLFCPTLNFPTGVPLGYFPTMHLQTAAYLALGLVTSNDVAIFNAIWSFGFVSTGTSTFLLARWAVGRTWPAWVAGLGTMLSGPMLMHAHGHLETMQMGAVPLFLIAWLRLVDRPGAARMIGTAALYLLVVASAPYFAVLAVFPAAWYVAWSLATEGRGRRPGWAVARSPWLVGFAGLVLPGLVALFAGQVWAAAHGYAMGRPRAQFDLYGAPAWSSFVPSPRHALGRLGPGGLFEATGYGSRMSECSSYLGVATLGLLAYAGARRVRFAGAGYWWTALAILVVLSWGSHAQVGSRKVGLPAGWLYGVFPPFHLIRVPARFNLFAAAVAAVPAAAGLADLLDRARGRLARGAVVAGLAGLIIADLAMVPFGTSAIPPMPACYGALARYHPGASLLEAPLFGTNEGQVFSSLWGYWQSIHRLPTSAGYPGLPNAAFEGEVVRASPWWAGRLADPAYLSDPASADFGPVAGVDARDYAWLFLTAHRFDFAVMHQGTWSDPKYAAGAARLKSLLVEARASEDPDAAIYDRARLRPPDRATWLCAEGWRPALARSAGWRYGVLRRARVVVYCPEPGRPVTLAFEGVAAFARPRRVRLVEGGRELGRWAVGHGGPGRLETRPLPLGAGLHELTVESDGDDRPGPYGDRLDDAKTPYSLRVDAVRLRESPGGG